MQVEHFSHWRFVLAHLLHGRYQLPFWYVVFSFSYLPILGTTPRPTCQAHLDAGHTASGVYELNPSTTSSFFAFCDMHHSDGKAWMILMQQGQIHMDCSWSEYSACFGDLEGAHWVGLENMASASVTDGGNSLLEVEFNNCLGNVTYTQKYTSFAVSFSIF